MSNPLHSILSRALSIRLNMQISLSSMPIVEEWMDIHLTRWLESIPLPPEMPQGHTAHFGVNVGTDLARLRWRGYGNPAGFIPKMAKYLESSDMTKQDLGLLDAMGNGLQPELVGTWVAVRAGQIETGWHFCDEHPFAEIEPLFADHDAKQKLISWLGETGIEKFRRFAQTVGEQAASEIEFAVPGVAIDDQLAAVSRAFEIFGDTPLPESAMTAMSAAVAPGFTVAITITDGQVAQIAAISPGLGNDVIAQLCADCGAGFHDDLLKLLRALGTEEPDRVEYARVIDPGGGAHTELVDLWLIPTDAETKPPTEMN